MTAVRSMMSRKAGMTRNAWLRSVVFAALATLVLNVPDALAQKKKAPNAYNVLPMTIDSVVLQGDQLIANGSVGGTTFSEPLALVAQPLQEGQSCPILNLSLGPINLTLLGLNVDTSAICLDITANEGQGLLGDLLCAVANLLNDGSTLGTAMNSLGATQQQRVLGGLRTILNEALAQATSSNALVGSTCSVLSLAVGPLDLNILGLQVELDDCADGPVTVDITATAGGGLLGDLLCQLSGALQGGPAAVVQNLLREITRLIGALLG